MLPVDDRIGAQYRLPYELWAEIFAVATSTPDKDDFSLEGAAYVQSDCDPERTPSAPTAEEESKAIKTRYNITQVCKYWYDIGNAILWTHLRIDHTLSDSSIADILANVRLNSHIASLVLKFTVQARLTLLQNQHTSLRAMVNDLIPCLPNVKIIRGPRSYFDGYYVPSTSIVILEDSIYSEKSLWTLNDPSCYGNVRTLSVDLVQRSFSIVPPERVSLPRLSALRIRSQDATISDTITRYWEIPNLRILSLDVDPNTAWLTCIEKWGNGLEKLELLGPVVETGKKIILPYLQILCIGKFPCLSWGNFIVAPRLRRLGLSRLNRQPSRQLLPAAVNHFLDIYGTIKEICLHGERIRLRTSLGELGELHIRDIEGWIQRGIEVDIRPDNRWRKFIELRANLHTLLDPT